MAQHKGLYQQGFSLLEVAIAMTVAGLLIAPAMMTYNMYQEKQSYEMVNARYIRISTAIAEFYSKNKRYPCPADITLSINENNHGVEQCASPPALENCTNGTCMAAGSPQSLAVNPQAAVWQGGVPYATLGISYRDTLDYRSNKIVYAVTRQLTDVASFDKMFGAIAVDLGYDEPTDPDTDNEVATPEGMLQYVLLSHGKNESGAITLDGEQAMPCDAESVEFENCDNDYVYLGSARGYNENPGQTYMDDMLEYYNWSPGRIWSYSENEQDIYNMNAGNVGIGTSTPQAKLDVNGNARAVNVHAEYFCDVNGSNCMPAYVIGGSGMRCSINGTAATGIQNNEPVCRITFPSRLRGRSCPNGQYIRGIEEDGDLICQTP